MLSSTSSDPSSKGVRDELGHWQFEESALPEPAVYGEHVEGL